ncbi:MAG: hypothetical protein M3Q19_08440 [Pseudomonadota bacterium]|nr:hypothetical protein [Pseudomonadota bacterium]
MSAEKGREVAAPLEWLAAAIGLMIFAGLFATILVQGLEPDRSAVPDLVVENQRIVPTSAGRLVEFTIHNRSAQTAAAVVIEGRLVGSIGQESPAQVMIDYVPARSKVSAGLIFPGDIRGRAIEIRPVGYRRP